MSFQTPDHSEVKRDAQVTVAWKKEGANDCHLHHGGRGEETRSAEAKVVSV